MLEFYRISKMYNFKKLRKNYQLTKYVDVHIVEETPSEKEWFKLLETSGFEQSNFSILWNQIS